MTKRKPRLESTRDYSLFILHDCNRPHHRDQRLADSMTKHGFLPAFPLLVIPAGRKLKIIQGHHRYMEAKQQSLRVYYVIVEPEADLDIFDFEGSTHQAWTLTDHIKARARAGSNQYIDLLTFQELHHLPMATAARLLGGNRGGTTHVKRGKFVVTGDHRHALRVVKITDACRAAGVDFATTAGFVNAVLGVTYVDAFNADTFIGKVRRYPKFMSRRSSLGEYLDEIEAMYNRASRRPTSLKFEAIKQSKERRPANFRSDVTEQKRASNISTGKRHPMPAINR